MSCRPPGAPDADPPGSDADPPDPLDPDGPPTEDVPDDVAEPAARAARRPPGRPALEDLVREPRQDHRREDRDELLDERPTGAGPADAGQAAEPVRHLVLLVAEDVARDDLAVLLVDLAEVGATGEQVGVVLAEGLEERPRPRVVTGVGLEAAEQRGEDGGGGRAHLVGGGPGLLGDLLDGQRSEDVVDGGHGGGPSDCGGPVPPPLPTVALTGRPRQGPGVGCIIES